MLLLVPLPPLRSTFKRQPPVRPAAFPLSMTAARLLLLLLLLPKVAAAALLPLLPPTAAAPAGIM
jgi:hypothetical protein